MDFGANRLGCFDLRRMSLSTAVEHRSASLTRITGPKAPEEPLTPLGTRIDCKNTGRSGEEVVDTEAEK
jgi:hypothetical protein